VDVEREHELAQVQDDVEGVLAHPDQVRELVQDPLDLDPGGRGPGDGRQQHPAVGIARRQGKPRLERLDGDLPVGALPGEPFVTDWKHQLLHGFPSSEFWGGSPQAGHYTSNPPDRQPSRPPGLTENPSPAKMEAHHDGTTSIPSDMGGWPRTPR